MGEGVGIFYSLYISLIGCSSVSRQANHKFCAAAFDVFGRDRAAKAFDELLDLPKTDAAAVLFAGFEKLKEVVG